MLTLHQLDNWEHNFNQNWIDNQENAFEGTVCKMSATLFKLQFVNFTAPGLQLLVGKFMSWNSVFTYISWYFDSWLVIDCYQYFYLMQSFDSDNKPASLDHDLLTCISWNSNYLLYSPWKPLVNSYFKDFFVGYLETITFKTFIFLFTHSSVRSEEILHPLNKKFLLYFCNCNLSYIHWNCI